MLLTFGWSRYWPYTSQEYTDVDRFKAEGVPLAVSVIDMDWHKTAIPTRFEVVGFFIVGTGI